MSFKIKQNGIVKDLKLPAASIEVLDMEDNYTTNNLEEVLQELGESDGVYITDDEPNKDGLWITNENITQAGENKTFTALKDYIEENVTPKVQKNTNAINQLSNPNLLINSDFRNPVNQKGKNSYSVLDGTCIDKWNIYRESGLNDISITLTNDGVKIKNTTDTQGGIFQVVHCAIKEGTILTVSAEIDGETRILTGVYGSSSVVEIKNEVKIGFAKHTSGYPHVVLYCQNSTEHTITNVKLELGSMATPFVPKSYVQELQDCLMYNGDTLTTPYSNPNILINGDFQIWQRGTNISCIPGIQYTADRWAMWTTENPTLSTSGWNLNWVGGGNDNLIQVIELPIRMIGTRMTLSFLIFAEEGVSIRYGVDNGTTINGADVTQRIECAYQGKGIWETIVLQVPSTVPTTSKLRVYFSCGASGKNKTIGLTNVKLELGSIATPFVSRSYGEELAMCQRYYQKGFVDFHTGKGQEGYLLGGTHSLPTEMRISPSIKYYNRNGNVGNCNLITSSSGGQDSVPNGILHWITMNNDANAPLNTFRVYTKYGADYCGFSFLYELDAEIY